MKTQVDVVIIGAGSAGLAAMRQVKKSTGNFVLINDGPYGTTCARVGCMPSKAFIEAANAYHTRHKAEAFGIRGSAALSIDIPAVLQRVRSLRDRFVSGVLNATNELAERSIAGRAIITAANTVTVADRQFVAKSIIIAAGSRPVLPAAWSALGERIITTDNFFEQQDLPARMAVVGLGAIGVEMAQALARLGIEVFAFNASNKLAGITDPAVTDTARGCLSEEFTVYTGHDVELTATSHGIRVQAGTADITVDRVLVAIGRTPNLDTLGLDTLGLALDKRGLPPFNRSTMQVADLPLFIAGDVNADVSLLHEAADEGYIAGHNATVEHPRCFARRTPLAIVFTDPGIAAVGKRFSDIDEASCVIGSVNFATQGRAMTAQRNRGLLRIYAARDNGRILGAEMCAPAAEHLSHLLALAIHRDLSAAELLAMPFYHPVLEEGLRTALRDITRQIKHSGSDLAACDGSDTEALD